MTGRRSGAAAGPVGSRRSALIGAALAGAAWAGLPTAAAAYDAGAGGVAAQADAPDDPIGDESFVLTPLGRAALHGDVEAAERQLREGADVNAASTGGLTPLMLAFQPLIRPPTTSGPDPAAYQALLARQLRKLRIARMLLDRGADLARADRLGMSALHGLVLMDGEEQPLVETLHTVMAKGADPNVSTGDGVTPLMLAVVRNRLHLVEALLSAGAEPNATARDGHTALSIARERGYAAIAQLLARKSRTP